MRIAVISFTGRGGALNRKVCEGLSGMGYETRGFAKSGASGPEWGLTPVEETLGQWTGKAFASYDGLIFIGACGIAVRAIAPFVRDKFKDPAVTVMDEGAGFAVSLLSGHVGGANKLTREAALVAGAVPVISTATDVNGKFAVDVFAADNGLVLSDRRLAKLVSARLLTGARIPFYSAHPVKGEIPEELLLCEEAETFLKEPGLKIAVSEKKLGEGQDILYLIPRCVTVGVGCRRGVSRQLLEEKVSQALEKAGLFKEAAEGFATIDIKREEEGLLSLAKDWGLPIRFFSGDELKKAPGEFSRSAFVEKTVGVDSVCERAAVCCGGKLVLAKQAGDGVTAAAASREIPVYFEKEKDH